MSSLDQRMTRLEEEQFFQEERLAALDAALAAQQRQLDSMTRELDAAVAVIRLLRDKLADQPENSPPPHFMPQRY